MRAIDPLAVYTVSEAAKLAKLHYQTVWKAVRTGVLEAHKPVGVDAYRVFGHDLIAWLHGDTPGNGTDA